MGNLYVQKRDNVEAKDIYAQTLSEFKNHLGQLSYMFRELEAKMQALLIPQARLIDSVAVDDVTESSL